MTYLLNKADLMMAVIADAETTVSLFPSNDFIEVAKARTLLEYMTELHSRKEEDLYFDIVDTHNHGKEVYPGLYAMRYGESFYDDEANHELD